jgi:hypothetical protein
MSLTVHRLIARRLVAHAYCIDAKRAISEPITHTSATTATIISLALKLKKHADKG